MGFETIIDCLIAIIIWRAISGLDLEHIKEATKKAIRECQREDEKKEKNRKEGEAFVKELKEKGML